MESWVNTLINDIKGKVGFTGQQLTRSISEQNDASSTDLYFDYFPSGLSASELRLFIQYLLKMRQLNPSHNLVNILGRLLFMEDLASESVASEPCLELDMSKMGHAFIAVPLRERSWPTEEGYSFACWFKYKNLKSQPAGTNLKLFSVSSTDQESSYSEELYLKEDGVLTLDINNGTCSMSTSSLELEEGQWYHLAVVIGPRNAFVSEHPSSIVYIYVDGYLRHTGEIIYDPLLVEEDLLITVGMPAVHAIVSDLNWAIRSFYLFKEQLSPDCVRFMYIISRGYKVLFQGVDVLDRSDTGAGGEDTSHIVDSETISESDGVNTDLTLKVLEDHWLELCGKKLICAFNATRTEALPASQSLRLLNLVDPLSFYFSPTGTTSSGHLCGDISICRRCVTGNIIHQFTGISVVLALVQSAETRDMLYIGLTLLASTLHQNPQRAKQMKACSGYQLLSLFLRTQVKLFDIDSLHTLFKIAVREDSSLNDDQVSSPEAQTAKILDELYLAEYHESTEDLSSIEGTLSHHSVSLDNPNTAIAPSFSGSISDGDLVEHVLLDWTIWATSPISIQVEILNFFETLVSVYKYKDHNLVILHERNTVHHVLVALHMDDIELLVMEKLVVLLGVILEDKFNVSELDSVTMFMLTTFDPPQLTKPNHDAIRESKSKRVTLRNMLLEALIDIQVALSSEELVEKWHSTVSSKLITCFLDEAVHPSTMGWIITLLGICLTSSSTFALKFQNSGGYQSLTRLLPKFNDSLDVYYTLFCMIFSKPIYPKLPEVGILDFEALIASNDDSNSLRFGNLLDSIVSMVKSLFDELRLQPVPAVNNGNIHQAFSKEFGEGNTDTIEEVGGEASLYSSPLLGWDTAANVTSILRLMANLTKMWSSFSSICARAEFLEGCVELYFSVVRTYLAVKATNKHDFAEIESPLLASEGDDFWHTDPSPQRSSDGNAHFMTSSRLLLQIDDSGYTGDPGSAGATAVLEIIAEVLSYSLINQTNSFPVLESILESVPLNFDSETVLTFKALCLDRIMNYLERRLLNNDQKGDQMLDNTNLWLNLGLFCSLVVDCVYTGVFPKPSNVMRVLEFCLSMLHSVKEESLPWSGLLLSIWRGNQPIDLILKSTNRMILYCFLPSFLATIAEDALISTSSFMNEHRKEETPSSPREETSFSICIVLELLHAHKEIVFHSGNLDVDVYCSLCINLIALFPDEREDAKNAAIGIIKYLLTHCRATLEEILISKPSQEKHLDVLNGGFDKLMTENVSSFLEWFQTSEDDIKQVLQQFAGTKWSLYIEESGKFPVERLGLLEEHRSSRMGKKVEDAVKLDLECRDEYAARRSDIDAKRVSASSELEHARQKKCELGIDAEDEWRAYLQQLSHEHKLENLSTMAWEDYWPLC